MIDTTPPPSPTPWVTWGQRVLLAMGLLGLLLVAAISWIRPPLPDPALSLQPLPAGCQTGLAGTAGRHTDLHTPGGLKYTVVAPANYNPQRQHGLLIMYPPAGFGSAGAERYYQFTIPANQQGFIVVYSDAIPLSTQALRLQSEIAAQVVARWCIDPTRVVYAGHSDGGSIATGLAVRAREKPVQPTQLLVSAAGIRGEDLQQETCPDPLHVNLLHNPQDERFPDYGTSAAHWWSACMQCTDSVKEANGCETKRCARGRTLRLCETSETHARWPALAQHFWQWEKKAASTPP